MHMLRTMLAIGLCSLLLTGCAATTASDGGLSAGVAKAWEQTFGPTPAQKKDATKKKLAPLCGTSTNWTAAQREAVSKTMLAHAEETGMQLLAPEWERLNDQVKQCRGKSS